MTSTLNIQYSSLYLRLICDWSASLGTLPIALCVISLFFFCFFLKSWVDAASVRLCINYSRGHLTLLNRFLYVVHHGRCHTRWVANRRIFLQHTNHKRQETNFLSVFATGSRICQSWIRCDTVCFLKSSQFNDKFVAMWYDHVMASVTSSLSLCIFSGMSTEINM